MAKKELTVAGILNTLDREIERWEALSDTAPFRADRKQAAKHAEAFKNFKEKLQQG